MLQCDPVYQQKFEAYDLDDDNKITLAELAETTKCTKGQMSTEFDEADKNGVILVHVYVYVYLIFKVSFIIFCRGCYF